MPAKSNQRTAEGQHKFRHERAEHPKCYRTTSARATYAADAV